MDNGHSKNLIRGLAKKADSIEAVFNKNVRFSVTLTAYQNKRMEVLLNKIDVSKQEFISKVIEAALLDLEDELDLISITNIDLLGISTVSYKSKYAQEIADAFGPELTERHRDKMGL